MGKSRRLWFWASVVVSGLPLSVPARVNACSGLACVSGAVLPAGGSSLPANAVEVLFRRPRAMVGAMVPEGVPHLYRVVGGAKTEVAVDLREVDGLVHVRPQQPVAAGSSLVFEYPELCAVLSDAGVFTYVDEYEVVARPLQVTTDVARPSTLGTLRAEVKRGPVELTYGSRCSESFDGAYADLRVELAESAKPYADSLRYDVEVDGRLVEPYGFYRGVQEPTFRLGASQLGAGKDRIFTLCEPTGATFTNEQTKGTHAVRMRARLPDDTEIWSDTSTISLRCDSPDSGGCSLARTEAAAGPSWLAGVALLLGLSGRRALRSLRARSGKAARSTPH